MLLSVSGEDGAGQGRAGLQTYLVFVLMRILRKSFPKYTIPLFCTTLEPLVSLFDRNRNRKIKRKLEVERTIVVNCSTSVRCESGSESTLVSSALRRGAEYE